MNSEAREFLDGMMAEQRRLSVGAAGFIAGYIVLASAPYVLLDINAPTEQSLMLGQAFSIGGWAISCSLRS